MTMPRRLLVLQGSIWSPHRTTQLDLTPPLSSPQKGQINPHRNPSVGTVATNEVRPLRTQLGAVFTTKLKKKMKQNHTTAKPREYELLVGLTCPPKEDNAQSK